MDIKNNPSPITYRDSGVDIDAGNALIDAIKPHAKRTARKGRTADLGGFGGLFDLKNTGFNDPILVAATDGVGTKLEIAHNSGIHRGLGIDLVAMCANDLLAQGAMPLFFLDYFATGKLQIEVATEVVAGIADGCVEAGCTLIGGETAEMPGIYQAGQYDLAGFCVGAVERDQILTPDMVKQGDVAIALPSSGIHANGFSLIRNLIRREGLDYNSPSPFDRTMSLAMSILAPTRIYRDAVEAALLSGGVTGVSHITGGGLIENPPRCYSEDLCLRLSVKHRPLLPVFQWVKFSGNMTDAEFARTFNCGIGGIVFVKEDKADSVLRTIQETGEDAWLAGQIEKRTNDAVILEGTENSWR